jgi:hypothetical protein
MSTAAVRAKKVNPAKPNLPPVQATMRAAAIDHYGSPDVLALHEVLVPEIGPKEVLIAVHTAESAVRTAISATAGTPAAV